MIELTDTQLLIDATVAPANPLIDVLTEPAREREQQEADTLAGWRKQSLDVLDRHALNFESFAPGKSLASRQGALIASYLDSQHDLSAKTDTDYQIQRDRIALKEFGQDAVGSDGAFFSALQRKAQFRKDSNDLSVQIQTRAADLAVNAVAVPSMDIPEDGPSSNLVASPWKLALAELESHPGFQPERVADYHESFIATETATREILAPFQKPLAEVWKGVQEGKTNFSGIFQRIDPGDREGFKNALGLLARSMPKEQRASFLGNLSKQVGRDFENMGVDALAGVGSTVREGGTLGWQDFLGTDDAIAKRDRKDAKTIKTLRERDDFIRDVRDIAEGVYDPLQHLTEAGSWARVAEDAAYATPGAIGSTAMAAIPYVGQAAFYGLARENSYQSFRTAFEANGDSYEDASRKANKLSFYTAPIELGMERLQIKAFAGKLPFFEKAMQAATKRISSLPARIAARTAAGAVAEGLTETGQNYLNDTVQNFAHALEYDVPEQEWLNGSDGIFDGFWKDFAGMTLTMLPLAVFGGLRGGIADSLRIKAFQDASTLELLALGVRKDDLEAFRAAETTGEKILAADGMMNRLDPRGESAMAATQDLAEKQQARRESHERLQQAGAVPTIVQSTTGYAVIDPETGETIATPQDMAGAMKIVSSHSAYLQDQKAEKIAYLATMLEAGEAALDAAADPVAQNKFELGKLMTDFQLAAENPESIDQFALQAADLETLEGGDGSVSRVALGQNIQETRGLVRTFTNRFFQHSSVLTLVHETGHSMYKRAIASGTITRAETLQFVRAVDAVQRGQKLKRGPDGVSGQAANLIEEGMADEAITDGMLEERVQWIMEAELLRSRKRAKGEKAIPIGGAVISRNLLALSRLAPGATRKFRALIEAARGILGLASARALNIQRGFREGTLDQAQYEAFLDKVTGRDLQAEHDGTMRDEAAQLAGLESIDESQPFSLGVTPQQDAEYLELAKDPEKNKGKLQAMVEKAAKAAGYVTKAFHGTDRKPFEVFKNLGGTQSVLFSTLKVDRQGFFFSEDSAVAGSFGDRVIPVYLKTGNLGEMSVYRDTTVEDRLVSEKGWNEQRLLQVETWELFDEESGVEFVEDLKGLGYDSVRIEEPAVEGEREQSTAVVVFDSNQIKSADPITRDEQGNVIPLSQRFNPQDDRITFSLGVRLPPTTQKTRTLSGSDFLGADSTADSGTSPFSKALAFQSAPAETDDGRNVSFSIGRAREKYHAALLNCQESRKNLSNIETEVAEERLDWVAVHGVEAHLDTADGFRTPSTTYTLGGYARTEFITLLRRGIIPPGAVNFIAGIASGGLKFRLATRLIENGKTIAEIEGFDYAPFPEPQNLITAREDLAQAEASLYLAAEDYDPDQEARARDAEDIHQRELSRKAAAFAALLDARDEEAKNASRSFVSQVWNAYAKHEPLFKYGKTDSENAADIAAAVSTPRQLVTSTDSGNTVRFMGPEGYLDIEDADTNRPYIRSTSAGSRGKLGGGGSQLYAAALDWVHNNNKRIKDDPGGITGINMVRRTSNFFASAIRWGTTQHLKPHAHQHVGKWTRNHLLNISLLATKEMGNAFKAIPDARGWTFDFSSATFSADGKPVTQADFAKSVQSAGPSNSGIGLSTLQRAIITASAIQEFQRGTTPDSLVEGTLPGELTGVAYSLSPVANTSEAEHLFKEGMSLFVVDERTERLIPVLSLEMLKASAPDSIYWTEPEPPNALRPGTHPSTGSPADAPASGSRPQNQTDAFSLAPAAMVNTLALNAAGRIRDPRAKAAVFERLLAKLDQLKRDKDEIGTAFGKDYRRKAIDDPRRKASIRKERNFREASRRAELEEQVMAEYEGVLEQEDLTRLKAQPVHAHLADPNSPLHGRLMSPTAAAARGKDFFNPKIHGDFDGASNAPRSNFGGSLMPDQAAQELYEAGLIPEPTADAMWAALAYEAASVAKFKEMAKTAQDAMRNARQTAKEEATAWERERINEEAANYSPRARLLRALAMLDAIVTVLPIEQRGRIGGHTHLARLTSDEARLAYLVKKLEKADQVAENWIADEYRTSIGKLFDSHRPKKTGKGVPKAKLAADYTDKLMHMEALSKLDKATYDARTDALQAKLEQTTDPDDTQKLTDELIELMSFGHLEGQNAQALSSFYRNLDSVITIGKTLKELADIEFKARVDELKQIVNHDVTGGAGRLRSSQAKARQAKRDKLHQLLGNVSKFHRMNVSFEWLMNGLARENKAVGTLESETHKRLSVMVHKATHAEKRANARLQKTYSAVLGAILGAKGMKLTNAIDALMTEQVKTGVIRIDYLGNGAFSTKTARATNIEAVLSGSTTYQDMGFNSAEWNAAKAAYDAIKATSKDGTVKGNRVIKYESPNVGTPDELTLSQSQAINLTMLFRQDGLRESMIHEGYTEETMVQMEAFLSDDAIAIRDWLTEEYANNYHVINAVFKVQNGVNLPQTKLYSPARRLANGTADDLSIDSHGGSAMSTAPNFTISRVTNFAEVDQSADALTIYMGHMIQTNHYVAWAEPIKLMRSIFGDAGVKKNITDYAGKSMLSTITERIEWFADGGNRKAGHLKFLDKMRAAHTYGSLAYNWGVAVKQLTSLPAYAFDMPFADFAKYAARFAENPVKHWREMVETEYVQTRFQEGYERDVIDGLRKEGGWVTKGVQAGMLFGKAGDIVPVIIGGWISKQRSYERAIESGMSEPDALAKSILDFEMSTDRAQQAGDLKDLSTFQAGGSIAKLFTMYKTSQRQYYANVAESLLDAAAGKKGAGVEATRRLIIGQLILPITFQFVSDLLRAPFNDDDDEDFDGADYVRAMLLGPLNGLFVAGDMADLILSGVTDTAVWAKTFPILDGGTKMAYGLRKLWNDEWADGVDDIARGIGKTIPNPLTFYDIIRRETNKLGLLDN